MTNDLSQERRLRVLLTKSFIDSHDRAIKTIAVALRDASMEVVLVDYEVAKDIVDIASEEDVDIIGVSFMSGGQVDVTKDLMNQLGDRGLSQLPVVIGGTIRPFDIPELEKAGVRAVFRGGEPMASIANTFEALASEYKTSKTD